MLLCSHSAEKSFTRVLLLLCSLTDQTLPTIPFHWVAQFLPFLEVFLLFLWPFEHFWNCPLVSSSSLELKAGFCCYKNGKCCSNVTVTAGRSWLFFHLKIGFPERGLYAEVWISFQPLQNIEQGRLLQTACCASLSFQIYSAGNWMSANIKHVYKERDKLLNQLIGFFFIVADVRFGPWARTFSKDL